MFCEYSDTNSGLGNRVSSVYEETWIFPLICWKPHLEMWQPSLAYQTGYRFVLASCLNIWNALHRLKTP